MTKRVHSTDGAPVQTPKNGKRSRDVENSFNGLTREQLVRAIELLRDSGAHIMFQIGGKGWHSYTADVRRNAIDELVGLIERPAETEAKILGVTVEELAEWKESEGTLRCTGMTASGRQCRNTFEYQMEIEEWAEAHRAGPLCYLHGGAK